jgi:hypothetical protein
MYGADATFDMQYVNRQTLNRRAASGTILWLYTNESSWAGMLLMTNSIPTFADTELIATNASINDYVFTWAIGNTGLVRTIYAKEQEVGLMLKHSGNAAQSYTCKPELYVSNSVSGACEEYGEYAGIIDVKDVYPSAAYYVNIYPPTNRTIVLGQDVILLKLKTLTNPSGKNLYVKLGSQALSDLHLSGNEVAAVAGGGVGGGGDVYLASNNLFSAGTSNRMDTIAITNRAIMQDGALTDTQRVMRGVALVPTPGAHSVSQATLDAATNTTLVAAKAYTDAATPHASMFSVSATGIQACVAGAYVEHTISFHQVNLDSDSAFSSNTMKYTFATTGKWEISSVAFTYGWVTPDGLYLGVYHASGSTTNRYSGGAGSQSNALYYTYAFCSPVIIDVKTTNDTAWVSVKCNDTNYTIVGQTNQVNPYLRPTTYFTGHSIR